MEEEIPKPNFKKVDYESADKTPIFKVIGEKFPKEFIPSKRINAIFGLIFVVALIFSISHFSLSSIMSGKSGIVLSIGFPLNFLKFDTSSAGTPPLSVISLIIDLFLYLVLSYAIDVSINLIVVKKIKEDSGERPVVFSDRKTTLLDGAVKKIFKS